MKFKLTLLFALTTFLSFGQTKDFKFGKVSEQEINLKEVSFEKDADAVILSEEGKIDLTPSNYYLTVKRRIKILTEKELMKLILNYLITVKIRTKAYQV